MCFLSQYGKTPLIAATETGSFEIVNILLNKGANPNARGKVSNQYTV